VHSSGGTKKPWQSKSSIDCRNQQGNNDEGFSVIFCEKNLN